MGENGKRILTFTLKAGDWTYEGKSGHWALPWSFSHTFDSVPSLFSSPSSEVKRRNNENISGWERLWNHSSVIDLFNNCVFPKIANWSPTAWSVFGCECPPPGRGPRQTRGLPVNTCHYRWPGPGIGNSGPGRDPGGVRVNLRRHNERPVSSCVKLLLVR